MSSISTVEFLGGYLRAVLLSVGVLFLAGFPGAASRATEVAEPVSIGAAVEELVRDALAANLELESSAADVQQRLAALDQARARYLPAIDFNARYSRAQGGRTLEIPVGDLLNPVYTTLNQLTGKPQFASIANQSVNFQRQREQQTEVSLVQPLYDARIGAGRAAAAATLDAAQAGHTALGGRIRRDMREAYYRWLQARAQVVILDATLELATENLRVNQSLLRNGKVTPDLVFRAEADQLEIQQSRLEAENGVLLAQSYVNLLRNAPFDRALPVASVADAEVVRLRETLVPGTPAAQLALLQDQAVRQRAELRQLDAAATAAVAGERLAQAAFRPQLAFALNAGTQGEQYGFTSDDRYVLASLVLKFNFFSGGADQAGLAGARGALRAARAARDATEQQIRLQVQQALQDLEVAEASLATAAKRVEAAAGAFRIASRKRDLGQINQAEFIDARRVLTDAQLNQNITRFAALSHLAELEYSLGAARQGATWE